MMSGEDNSVVKQTQVAKDGNAEREEDEGEDENDS